MLGAIVDHHLLGPFQFDPILLLGGEELSETGDLSEKMLENTKKGRHMALPLPDLCLNDFLPFLTTVAPQLRHRPIQKAREAERARAGKHALLPTRSEGRKGMERKSAVETAQKKSNRGCSEEPSPSPLVERKAFVQQCQLCFLERQKSSDFSCSRCGASSCFSRRSPWSTRGSPGTKRPFLDKRFS
jgi:hypothetical protein